MRKKLLFDWWGSSGGSGSEPVIDSDYQIWLDYLTSQAIELPSEEVQELQNQLVLDLKAAGVWDKRSKINLGPMKRGGSIPLASLTCLKKPGVNTESISGTVLWNEIGPRSNGTNGYIQTNFNPSTDDLYLQNDAGAAIWLDDNTQSTGIDFGVSDGSNQLLYQARNTSNQINAQINDNTNDSLSTCTNSSGFFSLNRTSLTSKILTKAGTAGNNATRTSTGRPNRNLTRLARDNNGTIGGYSQRTQGYFAIGGSLTQGERAAEYRAVFRYIQKFRALAFIVTDNPFESPLINIGGGATWDATSVFGSTIPDSNNIIYYNGLDATSAPADTREFEIGVFNLATPLTGSKYVSNPILTRSDLSITGASEGIMIFSFWDNDGFRYYFAARSFGDGTRDIVMLRGSTSTPYVITAVMYNVITAGDFNHSPFVIEHPTDSTKLLMFYSARTLSSDPLKLRVAEILKADVIALSPADNLSILNSDIATAQAGSSGMVYPCVEYSGGTYTLAFAEGYSNCGTVTFENRFAQSADFTSFTTSHQLDVPFGDAGFDGGYKAVPRLTVGNIYQSGRDLLGSSGPYLGISAKTLIRN